MNMELSGCYRMEVKSKAFDIPILTTFVSNIIKADTTRIYG